MEKATLENIARQSDELTNKASAMVVKELRRAIEWVEMGKYERATAEVGLALIYLEVAAAYAGPGDFRVVGVKEPRWDRPKGRVRGKNVSAKIS